MGGVEQNYTFKQLSRRVQALELEVRQLKAKLDMKYILEQMFALIQENKNACKTECEKLHVLR